MELDGCQNSGGTLENLNASLDETMRGYLEAKPGKHLSVPPPKDVGNYSGKSVLRISHSLHQRLALEATTEGVSLNQWALYSVF